jgi:hypothetical protein
VDCQRLWRISSRKCTIGRSVCCDFCTGRSQQHAADYYNGRYPCSCAHARLHADSGSGTNGTSASANHDADR